VRGGVLASVLLRRSAARLRPKGPKMFGFRTTQASDSASQSPRASPRRTTGLSHSPPAPPVGSASRHNCRPRHQPAPLPKSHQGRATLQTRRSRRIAEGIDPHRYPQSGTTLEAPAKRGVRIRSYLHVVQCDGGMKHFMEAPDQKGRSCAPKWPGTPSSAGVTPRSRIVALVAPAPGVVAEAAEGETARAPSVRSRECVSSTIDRGQPAMLID
jgi:hypothetical protein